MAAPYSVSLDADDARRLAERGGTLLLLGVPEGTSFGIDQQMFVTGPRFKGVKMLPPGPHFVYYSAGGKHGGAAPIIGFFVVLNQGQVAIRQWDAREERLALLNDEDQEERLAGGVRAFQFDTGLGAYDLHKYAAWQSLSSYITEEVVKAYEPVGGDICVVCEADVSESRPKTGAEKVLQEQIQKGRARGQPTPVVPSLDANKADTSSRKDDPDSRTPSANESRFSDVTQGVIIMDQGEDQDAAVEALGSGSGCGSGCGSGYGSGVGVGPNSGSGIRMREGGNGRGDGNGYRGGMVKGDGSGHGNGSGNENGSGKRGGSGSGEGGGSGKGDGNGNGSEDGDGKGDGNENGSGKGDGSRNVSESGSGMSLSNVDQIALMYQRKENCEVTNVGAANLENDAKDNPTESMDVDSKGGAVCNLQDESRRRQNVEQRERRDFAGLRGEGFLPGSSQPEQTGHVSSSVGNGMERSGEATGHGEAGANGSSSGKEKPGSSGRCYYTSLPRLVKRPGMSPSELTALNLDKSALLESVLGKQYTGREELLLGEMQFAFIAFVMGQSLESFAHWKAVLHLMLGCIEAPLRSRTRLFVSFLRALYWQLRHGPLPGASRGAGDALLDEAWFEKDNFLQHLLAGFFSVLLDAQPIDGELKQQADLLQNFLEGSLGWRLSGTEEGTPEDEDDEYAPMVVY